MRRSVRPARAALSAIITHTASPTRVFIFDLPRTKWPAPSRRELIRSRACAGRRRTSTMARPTASGHRRTHAQVGVLQRDAEHPPVVAAPRARLPLALLPSRAVQAAGRCRTAAFQRPPGPSRIPSMREARPSRSPAEGSRTPSPAPSSPPGSGRTPAPSRCTRVVWAAAAHQPQDRPNQGLPLIPDFSISNVNNACRTDACPVGVGCFNVNIAITIRGTMRRKGALQEVK